jgi:STE24 endopeptidase
VPALLRSDLRLRLPAHQPLPVCRARVARARAGARGAPGLPAVASRRRVLKSALAVLTVSLLTLGAFLLYPTAVPDNLSLGPVDVDTLFGADLVERARRYERFFYVDWLLAEIALLVTLWLYAKRGARFVAESAAGPIGTGMLLGMLGLAIAWLVHVPFALADHWWQRRWDQNDLSYLDWLFTDWAVLAAQFLSICVALLIVMGLARKLGERWWLPGAAVFVGIAALFSFVAPYLDFTTTPLKDKALLEAASEYEAQYGLGHIPLRVEKVSPDTDAANAYAFGMGPSRRVVFWDTILSEPFTEEEQKVVLAHELGHHASNHLPKGIGWFALFAVPGAWILMRLTRRRGGMGNPAAIPLTLFVVAVLQLVTLPLSNHLSSRMESEADWKALTVTRDPAGLEQLMITLGKTGLGDPDPPFLAQLAFGDHPSLADRIAMARAFELRR